MKEYKCILEASEVVHTINNLHCSLVIVDIDTLMETMDTENFVSTQKEGATQLAMHIYIR